MSYKKCINGHVYDAKLAFCPQCGSGRTSGETEAEIEDIGKTQPDLSTFRQESIENYKKDPGTTERYEEDFRPFNIKNDIEDPSGPTKPDFWDDEPVGFDPVVGWLICVKGSNRGKDYKLRAGNNRIGRNADMEIRIEGDERISRENAAMITYDDYEKIFILTAGRTRNLVRVNKKMVVSTQILGIYDRITVGQTDLIFVPLCGENFSWQAF